MSKGPTCVGGNWEYKRVKAFDGVVKCGYVGECDVQHTIEGRDLCISCIYNRTFDIPDMIKRAMKEKYG